jgi:hypothetical protein
MSLRINIFRGDTPGIYLIPGDPCHRPSMGVTSASDHQSQQTRAEAMTDPYRALSAAQLQACEQFAAHANHALKTMRASVIEDITNREQRYGIQDDSVSLWLTWEFVKAKMMEPGGPQFAAMLLSAALLTLARTPDHDPLAGYE